MVVHWEIFVWYMENVEYPPAPPNMEEGLCFYTKFEADHSVLQSGEYLAVMRQFLNDLIVKLALRVSDYEIEFSPQKESQNYVPNALMNPAKPRNGLCEAIWFLWIKCQGE
eukprot:jgi/Psemu1/26458/gm1.26458_g